MKRSNIVPAGLGLALAVCCLSQPAKSGMQNIPAPTRQAFCMTTVPAALTASATTKQTFSISPTATIYANTMRAGQVYTISAAFHYSSSLAVAPSITSGIDFNGVAVVTGPSISTLLGLSNMGAQYSATVVVMSVSGTSAVLKASAMICYTTALGTTNMTIVSPTGTVTVDPTIDEVVTPTVTYSSVIGSNSIVIDQFYGDVHDKY